MKHHIKTTIILLSLFIISQYFGLFTVHSYIEPNSDLSLTDSQLQPSFKEIPFGERPEFNQETSYISIFIAILLATLLLLGIIKFKAFNLWKIWFALALFFTISTTINAYTSKIVAITLGIVFTTWRIFKNNPYVQNLTEPLVYAGIAVIFAPVFTLKSIIILLILIAIYDAYAVWKSKHMITLAKAQSQAGVFAGLIIPNKIPKSNETITRTSKHQTSKTKSNKKTKNKEKVKGKEKVKKKQKRRISSAILGGGDIIFPLLFAATLLKDFNYTAALILPIFPTLALLLLFYFGQKNKFYPAMPFISASCLLGLGFIKILGII